MTPRAAARRPVRALVRARLAAVRAAFPSEWASVLRIVAAAAAGWQVCVWLARPSRPSTRCATSRRRRSRCRPAGGRRRRADDGHPGAGLTAALDGGGGPRAGARARRRHGPSPTARRRTCSSPRTCWVRLNPVWRRRYADDLAALEPVAAVAPRITDLIRTDVVEMSGRADLRAWWGAAGACGRAVVVPLAAAVARERLRAPPPAC